MLLLKRFTGILLQFYADRQRLAATQRLQWEISRQRKEREALASSLASTETAVNENSLETLVEGDVDVDIIDHPEDNCGILHKLIRPYTTSGNVLRMRTISEKYAR